MDYSNYIRQGEGPLGMEPMGMGQMDMMGGMGMGQMGMGGMGMQLSSSDYALINDISEAVIREVHAYNFYQRLIQMVPSEENRQIILGIQRDEAKHYHWFTMILRMMGAQVPQIPVGEMPTGLREGIRTAIRTELDAAAFYQSIAYRASAHPIQMHFMHASHDEQRHASLFQYMLTNL